MNRLEKKGYDQFIVLNLASFILYSSENMIQVEGGLLYKHTVFIYLGRVNSYLFCWYSPSV